MIEKTLKELGFTEGEVKAYLNLLKIGETTTGKIIEKAQISGGKIYQILNKLENKGLVSHIIKEKTKYFSAASPERIIDYLQEKKDNLTKKEREIEKELPSLLSLQKENRKKHETTLFKGLKGIETAIKQALNKLDSEQEVLAMGIRKSKEEKYNIIWEKWHNERKKKKIKGRFITSEKNIQIERNKYTQVRHLEGITPSAITIFGNTVLIQTYEEEPSCLLIKNEQIAKSFRTFFKTLWKTAKN